MAEVKDIEVHRGRGEAGELDLAIGVAMPVGFRLQATDDRLTVTSKARSRTLPYLTMFTALVDTVCGFYIWGALLPPHDPVSIAMAVAYAAMGAVPTYFTLAGWLNRTDVVVDGTGLRVRARPLKLPGLPDVDSDGIEAVNIEDDSFYTASRTRVVGFRVTARVRGRIDSVVLVRGLPERAQAEAIAAHVEKYLHLAKDPSP